MWGRSSAIGLHGRRARCRFEGWPGPEKAVHAPAPGTELPRGYSRWRRSRATHDCPKGWIRDGQTSREPRPTTSRPSLAVPDSHRPIADQRQIVGDRCGRDAELLEYTGLI